MTEAPEEPATVAETAAAAPQVVYIPRERQRSKYTPNFHQWVTSQTQRKDDVGECGRAIKKARMWYRSTWHLGLLLRAAEDYNINPQFIKRAHAEWRQVRRRTK